MGAAAIHGAGRQETRRQMVEADPLVVPESPIFPTVEELRLGILLETLVQAIYLLPQDYSYDSWVWHRHVLEISDTGDTVGCISFADGLIFGAFYRFDSERSPFARADPASYRAEPYFATAPAAVRAVALRDVLPSTNFATWLGDDARLRDAIEHETVDQLLAASPELLGPVITAAFWSAGDTLTAAEPWPEVYRHGANLLRLALAPLDPALAEWENGMQLAPQQVALARHLYERRRAHASPVMGLEDDEYARLIAQGSAQLDRVRQNLAAVGIALPGESIPPEQVAIRWR